MCGICLTLRQRLRWRRRATQQQQQQQKGGPTAVAAVDDTRDCLRVASCGCGNGCNLRIEDVAAIGAGDSGIIPKIEEGGPHSLESESRETVMCPTLFATLLENIKRRGPEAFGITQRSFKEESEDDMEEEVSSTRNKKKAHSKEMKKRKERQEDLRLHMSSDLQGISSVLGLRGRQTVRQPYEIEVETDVDDRSEVNKSFLQWNGEIFSGCMCPPPWGSDTVALASRLSDLELKCAFGTLPQCSDEEVHGSRESESILLARRRYFLSCCVHLFEEEIEGPYGFLFYSRLLKMAVFGRDPMGRHSLLVHFGIHPIVATAAEEDGVDLEFIVSSVGVRDNLNSNTVPAAAAEQKKEREERKQAESKREVTAPSPVGFAPPDVDASKRPGGGGGGGGGGGPSTVSQKRDRGERDTAAAPHSVDGTNATADPTSSASEGGKQAPMTPASPAEKKKKKFEMNEDEEEAEAGDGAAAGAHGCWTELPVTGLYGLALDHPVLQQHTDHPLLLTDLLALLEGDQEGRVCPLLHQPWYGRNHRVHPLLLCQERPEVPVGDEVNTEYNRRLPSSPEGNSPVCLIHSPTTSSLSNLPELPPLLAERIRLSVPLSSSDEDAWAHWAAVHYVYALSAAVLRRCSVATSGAEDGTNLERLFRARRRPLCVLFSGGIDCTVLAALAHYLLPIETPIELVNVAFGDQPEQAPDRLATRRAVTELLRLPQPAPDRTSDLPEHNITEREWRLIFVDVPQKLSEESTHVLDLIVPGGTVMDFDIGRALWYAARGEGRMQVLHHSDVPLEEEEAEASADGDDPLRGFSKHVRVAGAPPPVMPADSNEKPFDRLVDVLVAEGRSSGGPHVPVLLSTLGKEYAPFLQPVLQLHGYRKMGNYLSDAAKAGIVCFDPNAPSKAVRLCREADLRRACPPPPSPWYLTRGMLITKRRLQQQQQHRGPVLMPPTHCYTTHYVSEAKVLLLGTGADETLGGYTRYRRYFQRQGMAGARQELERDFQRLWQRNLGRDDRVTMDSGREPRFPFLDETLLRTLQSIVHERYEMLRVAGGGRPVYGEKSYPVPGTSTPAAAQGPPPTAEELLRLSISPVVDFTLPPGQGDKRVLRHAATIIGLNNVTRVEKRAIQFGSRIAERKKRGSSAL